MATSFVTGMHEQIVQLKAQVTDLQNKLDQSDQYVQDLLGAVRMGDARIAVLNEMLVTTTEMAVRSIAHKS